MKIHHCKRCAYGWAGRGKVEEPKHCPNCKSKYWNKERTRNPEAYNSLRTKNMLIQEAREHRWATKAQIRRIVNDHEKEAEAIA
jgi:hypothetical protein